MDWASAGNMIVATSTGTAIMNLPMELMNGRRRHKAVLGQQVELKGLLIEPLLVLMVPPEAVEQFRHVVEGGQ